jgi:hypothetical protein
MYGNMDSSEKIANVNKKGWLGKSRTCNGKSDQA